MNPSDGNCHSVELLSHRVSLERCVCLLVTTGVADYFLVVNLSVECLCRRIGLLWSLSLLTPPRTPAVCNLTSATGQGSVLLHLKGDFPYNLNTFFALTLSVLVSEEEHQFGRFSDSL